MSVRIASSNAVTMQNVWLMNLYTALDLSIPTLDTCQMLLQDMGQAHLPLQGWRPTYITEVRSMEMQVHYGILLASSNSAL